MNIPELPQAHVQRYLIFFAGENIKGGNPVKRLLVSCIIVVFSNMIFAQKDIDLRGNVKNSKGEAIAGATVKLVSDPKFMDTTDVNGAFSITSILGIRINSIDNGSMRAFVKSIQIKGNKAFEMSKKNAV